MKSKFLGFYSSSEDDIKRIWKSKETIFIFDTNVLLNIYSYKESTQNDFFYALNKIKNNVWIPYHVGLEYQRNRLDIVKTEKSKFRNANRALDEVLKSMNNDDDKFLTKRFPELKLHLDDLLENIEREVEKYRQKINELDSKQPCVRSHDFIRDKIDSIFENRVGEPPTQDMVSNIEKNGEDRYNNKVPPGFKDQSKQGSFKYGDVLYNNKYGDLIIWEQIKEHLKKSEKIKNVIFVTDDGKEDWWFTIDSGGNKRVGPHAFLINEIKSIGHIDIFDMYTTVDFLEKNRNYYSDINLSPNTITDIEGTLRNKEERNNIANVNSEEYFLQKRPQGILQEIVRRNNLSVLSSNVNNSERILRKIESDLIKKEQYEKTIKKALQDVERRNDLIKRLQNESNLYVLREIMNRDIYKLNEEKEDNSIEYSDNEDEE